MTIIIKNKETLLIDEFKFKCTVGKKGFSKNKTEGDYKTPIGIFDLGNIYYRSDRIKKPISKIKVCKINEIPCNETNFTFEDIRDCEEAFVTGTFAGIIPVSKIENYMLNSTNTSSLVNKIRASYNQYINQSIESQ